MARGHVEVILNLDRSGTNGVALNRQLIAGYVQAFRAAADEFGVEGEPDLNVVLRMPGAMDSGAERSGEELEAAVMARVEEALSRLNQMREEEGRSIDTELRARMAHLEKAAAGVESHRSTILRSYSERLQSRMSELLGAQVDKERILQEVAVLVDRSDIQEELVRLNAHVKHFLGIARPGRRGGQENGLPVAGDEPRGEHAALEDLGPGGRGVEDYRDGPADEVGDRKITRAGAEPGMSIVYIVSAPSGSGKSTLVTELLKMVA